MIDALGFKGIQAGYDPEAVLEAMMTSKRLIEREFLRYVESNRILIGSKMSLRFMSDTIIICLQFDKSSLAEVGGTNARFACFTVCELVLVATNYWATSTIPLTFRGAISCGPFCSDEEFFVGHAVDTCAELYEQAQGAFVLLSEEISTHVFETSNAIRSSNTLLVPYDVPLKGERRNRLHVLHTGIMRAQSVPRVANRDLQAIMLATFDVGRSEVAIKHENTKDFFLTSEHFLKDQ